MKFSMATFATALGIAGMAALGGAMAVFSAYDDSPGGTLLGFLLIMGAVALGMKTAQRRADGDTHSHDQPAR